MRLNRKNVAVNFFFYFLLQFRFPHLDGDA